MSEFEINNEVEEIDETEEYEEDVYVDEGSVAASVLGGLVGMFIALILCTAVFIIFDSMPYILFFLFPLCVCFMSLVFKGSLNKGGLVCEIIFTALGIFMLPAFFTACHYVKANGTSFLSVPLVALSEIGNSNFFTNFGFTTSTVFPILIAVIGIIISWQILRLKKAKLHD
ncbi:MAG: hypothetical protein IJ017_00915 [Oscillospiraceae bacterium]|nr:hypothetical protein [Oscillospiraceae bacterium]